MRSGGTLKSRRELDLLPDIASGLSKRAWVEGIRQGLIALTGA